MDYVIKTDDLCRMIESCNSYRDQLSEAVDTTDAAIAILASSDLIEGEAAQASKSYYQDVHVYLSQAVLTTYQYLEDQFVKYCGLYTKSQSPIAETGASILPSDEIVSLGKKSGKLENRLDPIDSQVSRAVRLVSDARCSVSHPTMGKASSALETLRKSLEKLDADIGNAEGEGLSFFLNDAKYQQTLSQLNGAIASAAKMTSSSYSAGSFFQFDDVKNLSPTLTFYQDQWNANSENRVAIENKAMTRVNEIRQAEYEKKATWKKFWDEVGTGLAVAGFLVGAAALVTTTGPFGIAFGVYGAVMQGKDALDRVGNLFSSKNDLRNKETTSEEIAEERLKDGAGSTGFEVLKGLGGEYDNAHDGDMTNQYEAHRSFIGGVTSAIGGGYAGAVTEMLTYETTGDARLAGFEGDVVSHSVSTAINAGITGEFDIGDGASFGFKMGTIVADYGSDVCAADMAEISDRMDNTNKLIEKNSNAAPRNFTFGPIAGAA